MKKFYTRSLVFILLLSFMYPISSSALDTDYNYTYRQTDVGMGVRQVGQWENEIITKKQEFSRNESVIVLSRIFNITNIDTFQFKYELNGAENRSFFSEVYKPRHSWWAEVWSVTELGRLSPGVYNMDVYISINNGAYLKRDSKTIRVYSSDSYDYNNTYYQDNNNYNYDNYNNYNPDRGTLSLPSRECGGDINYSISWLATGEDVDRRNDHVYDLDSPKDRFDRNENVYVLLRSHQLRNIESFRVKFEVYRNGTQLYRTRELPIQIPACRYWDYNFAYSDLGKMSNGTYEIRAYIKFVDRDYIHIASRGIVVGSSSSNDTNQYNYAFNYNNAYSYGWTNTATNVNFHGDYYYSVSNPRDNFSVYDEVKVLTRLSNIRDIYKFEIRHDLYRGNNYVKKVTSSTRYPKNDDWEYNFTQGNFGRLTAGDYTVKAYISIEGGAWKYLGEQDFEVSRNTSPSSGHYNYDWTIAGTDFDY